MLIFSSSLLFSIILSFFQQRNNRFHSFMEDHVTCVTKRRSTFSTITEFQLDSREIDFSTCPYLLPFSFFFLFFLCFSFFFSLHISPVSFLQEEWDGDVCRPSAARLQKRTPTIGQLHCCCRHTGVTIFPDILAFRRDPRGPSCDICRFLATFLHRVRQLVLHDFSHQGKGEFRNNSFESLEVNLWK